MKLTIIIPTYNRVKILVNVLNGLNNQTYDMSDVEVLVYDDCSLKNPWNEISKIKTRYKLRFFRMKKNLGQGNVRNEAIKLALGEYVFFTGDDMIPDKNLIQEHMNLHMKNKGIAVLGYVSWENSLRNEFMNFIEGIQFHYKNIKDKNNVKFHFYTSNISLEKSWFDDEKYSPEFKNYGLEDLELGYRLEKKGLRVIYNSSAIVYHYHPFNFEDFCKRMRNVGKSVPIFVKLHPELKKKYIPSFPLNKIYYVGSFLLSRKPIEKINKKLYWYSNFVLEYLKGIEETAL